jgi:ankyrin repeat protein
MDVEKSEMYDSDIEMKSKAKTSLRVIYKLHTGEFSPLLIGILKNDRKEIKKYIQENKYIKTPSKTGITPIALATLEGDMNLVKELLNKGADINFQDSYGRTPIIYAGISGREEIIKEIKQLGGDINKKDRYMKSAKNYILERKKYFKTYGETKKQENHTSKYYSKLKIDTDSEKLIDAIKKRKYESVKDLINRKDLCLKINYQKPSNFNIIDGFTPLMYAVLNENIEIVKILIKNGADVNSISKYGKTALVIAQEMKNKEIMDFLISNGGDTSYLRKSQVLNKKDMPLNSIQTIMNNSILKESALHSQAVKAFFGKLQKVDNYHIQLLLHVAALATKEKNSLKYYFTIRDSISDLSMNPINKFTRGEYDPKKNTIRISSLKDTDKALGTFIHETTHMLRELMKNKHYDDLINSTILMKNNYYQNELYRGSRGINEQFRKNIIERTDKGIRYSNINKIIEENIADYIRLLLFYELRKESRKDLVFEKTIEPLKEFFEKKMVPQMEAYILKHRRKNEVKLSELVFEKLKINRKNLKCKNLKVY